MPQTWGEITADPVAVKGKGIGTDVESQISENETFSAAIEHNSAAETSNTTTELDTAENSNSSIPSSDQAIESVDTQDLNDISENETTDVTSPQVDTTGIVMQTA